MHVNQLEDFQVQPFFFNSMDKVTKPELDTRMLSIDQVGHVHRDLKICYLILILIEIVRCNVLCFVGQ
jgi:hypothetical protein